VISLFGKESIGPGPLLQCRLAPKLGRGPPMRQGDCACPVTTHIVLARTGHCAHAAAPPPRASTGHRHRHPHVLCMTCLIPTRARASRDIFPHCFPISLPSFATAVPGELPPQAPPGQPPSCATPTIAERQFTSSCAMPRRAPEEPQR
jgi:hypothetical protein